MHDPATAVAEYLGASQVPPRTGVPATSQVPELIALGLRERLTLLESGGDRPARVERSRG